MDIDPANAVVGSSPTTEDAVLTSLAKLVKEKGSNPSLLASLAAFLLDASPDPVPITEETHPVFYHGTKNDGKILRI